MRIKKSAKTWTIRYTRPKKVECENSEPKIFQYNHCSVVIAETCYWAIAVLQKQFPDAVIVSVNPGSIGPVIVDPAVVADC